MKTLTKSNVVLLPRMLRLRDAPSYLGMDRNRFNAEVRPGVTEIPIGEQGIAFDRLELDAWVDDYISLHGRKSRIQRDSSWRERKRQDSSNGRVSGISTNASTGNEFARALEQISLKKQSGSSRG